MVAELEEREAHLEVLIVGGGFLCLPAESGELMEARRPANTKRQRRVDGSTEAANNQNAPPLMARQYRELWLDSEHELGQVAETLACALGWQPTEAEPLPNALELAEAVAERLLSLQAQTVFATLTHRQLDSNKDCLQYGKISCNLRIVS